MSHWEKIKDNWGQITVFGGILLVISGSYLEWRLTVNFTTNLKSEAAALKINELIDMRIADIDIATDQKVVSMDTNITTNTVDIGHNKEEITENEQKLRDVANILMGE